MGCLRQGRVKQPSPPKKQEEDKEPEPVAPAKSSAVPVNNQAAAAVNPYAAALGQKTVVPAKPSEPAEAHGSALAGSSLLDDF